MPNERFRADAALAPLKVFQRRTVDYVFDRLYGEDDPVRQFLVADEVGLGKTMLILRRCADGEVITETRRQLGQCHRNRTGTHDDEVGARQHRLDEHVHGSLAGAGVPRKANAVALFTGPHALLGQEIAGLNRDQARLSVGQGFARRLQHGGTGTAAADPAVGDGAIGANDRLGTGLGRRDRDGAHHGRQHEGLAFRLQAGD